MGHQNMVSSKTPYKKLENQDADEDVEVQKDNKQLLSDEENSSGVLPSGVMGAVIGALLGLFLLLDPLVWLSALQGDILFPSVVHASVV